MRNVANRRARKGGDMEQGKAREREREGGRWRSVDGGKWKWKPKTQTDIGIVTSLVNPLTGAGASV